MNNNDTDTKPEITISLSWLVTLLTLIIKAFEATGGKLFDWFGQSMTNEEKSRTYVRNTQTILSKTTGKDLTKGANSKKKYNGETEGVRLNAWRLIWMPIAFLMNLGEYSNKEKK